MGIYYAKAISYALSYHAKRQGYCVKRQLYYKYSEIVALLSAEAFTQVYAAKAFLKFAF